ncbi:hypothetical protein ACN24M_01525 [Streptomyces microflavus]
MFRTWSAPTMLISRVMAGRGGDAEVGFLVGGQEQAQEGGVAEGDVGGVQDQPAVRFNGFLISASSGGRASS